MIGIPDLSDPRYLREVGWFLRYQKSGPYTLADSFEGELRQYSRLFLQEVLASIGQDECWLSDKTVVSIGCGCTGDLTSWPAQVKIGVDPLLQVYLQLDMLAEDVPGTSRTVYLASGVEDLSLIDGCADLVVCRNALDHMETPNVGVNQISRILKPGGLLYLSVDVGGPPTPDEPSVFTKSTLLAILRKLFTVMRQSDRHPPFSKKRDFSMRLLAKNRSVQSGGLQKETILNAYLDRYKSDY